MCGAGALIRSVPSGTVQSFGNMSLSFMCTVTVLEYYP